MNKKKKIFTVVGLVSMVMTSCGLEAAPPEHLSVAQARNIINGTATLPDSTGVHWVLDKARQGSGWQFNAQKALTVLAREGARVTRGGMYREGNNIVHYMISSTQTVDGLEGMAESMYEMLFKQAGVPDDGAAINAMMFGKSS